MLANQHSWLVNESIQADAALNSLSQQILVQAIPLAHDRVFSLPIGQALEIQQQQMIPTYEA
eukprot:2039139-Karenia_brevis.AAC.1